LKYNEITRTNSPAYLGGSKPFVENVEKRSGGRLKIELFTADALFKSKEVLTALDAGIADFGVVFPAYMPKDLPLALVTDLPFAYPDMKTAFEVIYKLFQTPVMEDYMAQKGLKMLYVVPRGSYQIYTTKKWVKSMDDLKGMKIRGAGGMSTKMLKALGASPVSIPMLDAYPSLQRGLLDGVHGAFGASIVVKHDELLKYFTIINSGTVSSANVISLKSFNKLPRDLQQILVEEGKRINSVVRDAQVAVGYDQPDEFPEAYQKMKERGVQFYTLSPAEREAWKAATASVWDEWLSDVETKGLPGKQVLEEYRRLLKEATQG
jgi:TRAP-type C4-dicarboxylate transport system substrate-binding protein